jgi:7-cyano-7-deazaguanine synthase
MNATEFSFEHPRQSTLGAGIHRQRRSSETRYRNRLCVNHEPEVTGVLVSGGLDSSILLKHLLDVGRRVKPFYISSGLFWQAAEQVALKRYLDAVAVRELEPLTVLELPLADVYGDHWSITGRNTPEAGTPDEAVYLPGRNALLSIKAVVWCQMHGIEELALATLRSNPFPDASALFFDQFGDALTGRQSTRFRLTRPFGELDKQAVMELGRAFPLASTFSCIAPRDGAHCGQCNKCAERQAAFHLIESKDPTNYASVAKSDHWSLTGAETHFRSTYP